MAAPEGAPGAPLRAVVYTRVSTPDQAKAKPAGAAADTEQETSLAAQEATCRRHAAQQGYVVVGVEADVHTGAELWERPGWERVRALVAAGGIDVLLAYSVDRLSRSQVHVAVVVDHCARYGCRVAFATEAFEDSAVGRFVLNARAFAAELEREKIRERTQNGRRARLRAGKPLAGPRPKYGYAWADPLPGQKTRLVPDDEKAAVVRRVYRDLAGGLSARRVCRTLGAEAVPTPTGIVRDRGWDVGVLTRLVADPAYKGAPAANRRALWRKKAPAPYTKHEADWIALPEGVAPALVDAATWERANATVRGEIPHPGANGAWDDTFLLGRGRATCGWCGAVMVATMSDNNRRWAYYRCGAHKRDPRVCRTVSCTARLLDAAAVAYLREQVQAWEEDAVAADIARRTAPREREPAEAAQLRRTIARLQKQERNLVHLGKNAETLEEADAYGIERRAALAALKRARDRLDDLTAARRTQPRAHVYARAAAKVQAMLRRDGIRAAVAAVDLRVVAWGTRNAPPWEFRCAELT